MPRPPPQSFLLRLWREQAGAPLRATLVPVAQPAAQRHFADLEALYAFLCEQTGAEPIVSDETRATHCTPLKSR
jgi:hypothetical protein